MIRLAAVGDVHFAADSPGRLRPHLEAAAEDVDALLLAGDLTHRGRPEEARVLAGEVAGLELPILAVLGNHDYHLGAQDEIGAILREAGVHVLEGSGEVVAVRGVALGVAGVKGFCGGFAGACVTEFGEPEVKAFAASARRSAESLRVALDALHCDVRVALLHYAPVEATLVGEPPGLWPFLGSYLLAEAADAAGAALILHGHAHAGSAEEARTPGGVPVRNVAQPVIRRPFALIAAGAD
ncbi:MAG: metallophosphoesterase [Chloroflexi bacterium]|nr:MAG: metallophosphoesterase [Chloroflexota bacterium]